MILIGIVPIWMFAGDFYIVVRAIDGKIADQDFDDAPALKLALYVGAIPGWPMYTIGRFIYLAVRWTRSRFHAYTVQRQVKEIIKEGE